MDPHQKRPHSKCVSVHLRPRKALHESALEKKALGFGEIPLEPDNERQVAKAEDITDQMLKPPEETKPSLPYAKVRLLKGALNSFQAWQAKSSKCMGVILGRQAGANFDGLKIIVSCDHSLTELVGHEKVVQLCQQEKLVPCGLILGEDKNRPEIETLLDNMVTKAPAAVCIFAARHSMCECLCGRAGLFSSSCFVGLLATDCFSLKDCLSSLRSTSRAMETSACFKQSLNWKLLRAGLQPLRVLRRICSATSLG